MVAGEVGVSRSAVQQIINRHPNDLAVRPGSGLQGKINESEIEYLTELYISNPKLTLQMYADKLLEKYAVDVTPQTIHHHLKKIKKLVGER
jgi:transposase